MARQRKQVDVVLLHIHRNLARSLYAVNVEKDSLFLGDLADLCDRIDYPDLVIGVHDRDQDGLRGDGAAQVVQVDAAVLLHRQIGDLEAVLLQALAGVQHRLMFDRSEEHTSELQSRLHLVCRLLLEKKKTLYSTAATHSLCRSRQLP